MLDIKRRSQVAAVNLLTGEVRPDAGSKEKPRVYTVEWVGNYNILMYTDCFKLCQIGTYDNPLYFDLHTGLPYLNEHSYGSMTYKLWKDWKIVKLEDLFNATNSQ